MKEDTASKKPSYEKFHYGLRTAKNIERKMLCEAFQRLSVIDRLDRYRYIGFGSTYFTDFILFHKCLGFTDMVSIEYNEKDADRFRFNCPFRCIKVQFGSSTNVLPVLNWHKKSILWLDYDYPLDASVLTDISFFCTKAVAGSILLVTVDAQPGDNKENDKNRLERLQDRVGIEKVPAGIKKNELAGRWGTATVSQKLITNEIDQILSARNGMLSMSNRIQYKQLFNFHYADVAEMLTVGGILYDNSLSEKVRQCAFDSLDFVRTKDAPCLIEAPNLTYRELRYLDSQMPLKRHRRLKSPGVSDDAIEKYKKVYRYFPTFVEADI